MEVFWVSQTETQKSFPVLQLAKMSLSSLTVLQLQGIWHQQKRVSLAVEIHIWSCKSLFGRRWEWYDCNWDHSYNKSTHQLLNCCQVAMEVNGTSCWHCRRWQLVHPWFQVYELDGQRWGHVYNCTLLWKESFVNLISSSKCGRWWNWFQDNFRAQDRILQI